MAKAAKTKTADNEVIRSVKGFNHELQCRGFQFEVGKTYKVEGKIEACENGFHACENPFDIWSYYPVVDDLGRLSRYAEVEQSGDISRRDGDSKIASAEITIKAEIALRDFIRRAVNAVVKLTKGKGDDPSGDYARIGSSGDSARIGSSGYSARIGSSGYSARIGSSGDYARIGSSGDYARIVAEGKEAVVASAGRNATATGVAGTWISLAEFDSNGKCLGFATGCIGQDGLEPNVAYVARGGKLVAA